MSEVTNKSKRGIDIRFDIKQFNTKFDKTDDDTALEAKKSTGIIGIETKKSDDIINDKLPHKKPIQDIIVNIREMFYDILELLINKKNPIPFVVSSPDRFFACGVFLFIFGSLLLLFSNLMKSN